MATILRLLGECKGVCSFHSSADSLLQSSPAKTHAHRLPDAVKGTTARAYAIKATTSSSVAVKGKEVLQGILYVHGIPGRVLFNTGASHSFISRKLVDKLNLAPTFVDEPICVSNHIGHLTNLCMICKE